MRYVLPWLLLSLAALGQSAPTRIAPDEAAKHLIKKSPAIYPSLAETARIQGNVIIEISILTPSDFRASVACSGCLGRSKQVEISAF